MDETTVTGLPGPGLATRAHVADLRRLIDGLEHDGADAPLDGSADRDEVVTHLETAYEELRVAEEEVRVQQEQIVDLLDDQRDLRSGHERLLAALPVAVVVTDLDGTVRVANAAAGRLLGSRVASLPGKPVASFFDTAGRAAVRRGLSALRGGEQRAVLDAGLARAGDTVEVSAARTVGDDTRLTWMLLDRPAEPASGVDEPAVLELPAALVALAATPARIDTVQELLSEAARLCRDALGDDVEVSVTTGSPLEPSATSTTSQLAQGMDGAQLATGEGPCVRAYETGQTTWTSEVATDDRWPGLSPHVPEEVKGVVAVPLGSPQAQEGVLNVYLRSTAAPDQVRGAAELLGATIGSILHELTVRAELRGLAEQMERALASRAVIDQAKGIIMGDKGWDADRAFAHLVSLSSANGVKVRDLARVIVDQSRRQGGPESRDASDAATGND